MTNELPPPEPEDREGLHYLPDVLREVAGDLASAPRVTEASEPSPEQTESAGHPFSKEEALRAKIDAAWSVYEAMPSGTEEEKAARRAELQQINDMKKELFFMEEASRQISPDDPMA